MNKIPWVNLENEIGYMVNPESKYLVYDENGGYGILTGAKLTRIGTQIFSGITHIAEISEPED